MTRTPPTPKTSDREEVRELLIPLLLPATGAVAPKAPSIGGMIPPELDYELTKLIRKLKKRELRRNRRPQVRVDNARVSRLLNALLAVKALSRVTSGVE